MPPLVSTESALEEGRVTTTDRGGYDIIMIVELRIQHLTAVSVCMYIRILNIEESPVISSHRHPDRQIQNSSIHLSFSAVLGDVCPGTYIGILWI